MSYVSTYGITRIISKIVSCIGWLAVAIGLVVSVIMLVKSMEQGRGLGLAVLFGLIPALSATLGGLLIIIIGQITRAAVDSADHTGEILAIINGNKAKPLTR